MSGIVPKDPHEPITPEMWQALRDAYPNTERLATAFALALDTDACSDLLAGRPVAPERLDHAEAAKARRASLVRLVAPIDLLLEESAA